MNSSDKFKEGQAAFKGGASLSLNPYTQPDQIEDWKSWYQGYKKAERLYWQRKIKEQ